MLIIVFSLTLNWHFKEGSLYSSSKGRWLPMTCGIAPTRRRETSNKNPTKNSSWDMEIRPNIKVYTIIIRSWDWSPLGYHFLRMEEPRKKSYPWINANLEVVTSIFLFLNETALYPCCGRPVDPKGHDKSTEVSDWRSYTSHHLNFYEIKDNWR